MEGEAVKKLNVLLVDDEIKIREGFKKLFDWEKHGCEVVGEAADGMEAINQIELLKPDIVIMDINIPIMNGLKVIELSRMKYPSMAFVIVSGYDDFAYCQQALRLQITDYILKPVNFEEFGTCIDRLKMAFYKSKIHVEEENHGQDMRMIVHITKHLQEHLDEEISLTYLAEQFHLSAQYISQLFKNEIGVDFLAYLTNLRMEKARKLLATTAMPIAEVAGSVGYNDYRAFTKVFKKNEGMTPLQYRREFYEGTIF
ncbi:MAG: response regulator [Anaerostipes faecalis]|nr:response regulator [Anaerostipes faecalis]